MTFTVGIFLFYLGLSGLDEASTAWAIQNRPELRSAEIGLPPRFRIPARFAGAVLNTYVDRRLEKRPKARWWFRGAVIGLHAVAIGVAIKRGLD